MRNSPKANNNGNVLASNHYNILEIYTIKIKATSSKSQWVNEYLIFSPQEVVEQMAIAVHVSQAIGI